MPPTGQQDSIPVALLIPAWYPGPSLAVLCSQLTDAGLARIVVVDDGSPAESQNTFSALGADRVEVLHHAVNLGKGRALKTGFNHLLIHHSSLQGVVTADADGQHTAADILALARIVAAGERRLVLGSRDFGADVPLRSKFGNTVTRNIFALLTGTKLRDTQTGLRGFAMTSLPGLLALEGERYEYEMTVLAHLCAGGHRPLEVPIQTVYIDNNRSSHFDPVRDSMRIYFILLRFYVSSIVAAGIDLAGFTACFALTHNMLLSVAVGRLSSVVNFALNRSFVFRDKGSLATELGRYYLLVIAIGTISYLAIRGVTVYLHWNVFASKIVVDVLLSLLSFSTQRTFVFRRKQEA